MTMIGTLNFYTVQGWMVSELHLTGHVLITFPSAPYNSQ